MKLFKLLFALTLMLMIQGFVDRQPKQGIFK